MKNQIKTYQSNQIIKASDNLSIVQKRLYYQIAYTIQNKYNMNRMYDEEEIENLIIELEPQQLDDCSKGKRNRMKIFEELSKMVEKTKTIKIDKEIITVSIINYSIYNEDTDKYTIEVSKKLIPHLINLKKEFTVIGMVTMITLRSEHSQRMYEICNMYRNRKNKTFFLTVENIIEMFDLKENKSYNSNTALLKNRVIERAEKELKELFENNQSDLYFTYKVKEKKGKKELSYYFYIHTNKIEEAEAIDYTKEEGNRIRVINIIKKFVINDKRYYQRVNNALQLNPDKNTEILEKLYRIVEKYETEDIARLIRYVLNEDYNIIQNKNEQ